MSGLTKLDPKVTIGAGAIIDIMSGGKLDWRSRLEDSDFLESADWQTAVEYARAAQADLAPMELDGVTYTKEGIASVRKDMIDIRDEALRQNEFAWAVILSHNIALLQHLHDNTSE